MNEPDQGAFRHPADALAQIDRIGGRDHFVQFYKEDQTLINCVARFFAVGFAQGNAAIVIATPEHQQALDVRLRRFGLDLQRLRDSGDYLALDARETLSSFMEGDRPDSRRFRASFGSQIESAIHRGAPVRAFGEMVAALCADGNDTGAIELEHLWNHLGETHEFALFCGYPAVQFAEESKSRFLSDIFRAHSRVITG